MKVTAWIVRGLFAIGLNACSNDAYDAGPVDFLNLRVEDIEADRAVVRFETSIETTCQVDWGLTEDDLSESATDPDMDPNNPYSTTHRVPLEDLPGMAVIFYRAKATTRSGAAYYSELSSFETLAGDTGSEGPSMVNVALLDVGTEIGDVSSNYGGADNDATWGANAAIDGKMSTEWSSNGDGDDAFIELELGSSRTLERFGFRSRMMTDGSSIIESVRLILDGETELGPFETPDPDQRYEFELDPVVASRVRVEAVQTTGGNTGAKEIELFERTESGE